MNKIRTVFVDDDFLALGILNGYSSMLEEIEVVAQIQDPLKAVSLLQETKVHLLFLDIHMEALKGNELLKILNPKPVTIFTTAFTDYALEAYDLNAVDYLIKPFSFERFLQAFNKAKEVIKSRDQVSETLIHTSIKNITDDNNRFITVKDDKKLNKIYLKDILFLEGCKEYVKIHTETGIFLTLDRLKNLENVLPSGEFLRVHKSYIIPLKKVIQLAGNEIVIGNHKIPISREQKDEVVKKIFG